MHLKAERKAKEMLAKYEKKCIAKKVCVKWSRPKQYREQVVTVFDYSSQFKGDTASYFRQFYHMLKYQNNVFKRGTAGGEEWIPSSILTCPRLSLFGSRGKTEYEKRDQREGEV